MTLDLKQVASTDLEKELKERKRESTMPPLLPTPDWAKVQKYVAEGVAGIATSGYPPKDFDHFVFEATLEALYGRKIWDWYNTWAP